MQSYPYDFLNCIKNFENPKTLSKKVYETSAKTPELLRNVYF